MGDSDSKTSQHIFFTEVLTEDSEDEIGTLISSEGRSPSDHEMQLSATSARNRASEDQTRSEILYRFLAFHRHSLDLTTRIVKHQLYANFPQAQLSNGGPFERGSPSGTSPASACSDGVYKTSSKQTSQEQRSSGSGKRKRDAGRHDGNENSKRVQVDHDDLELEEVKRFLACPYFQHNRSKYGTQRGCPGPGWPNVHRVKYASRLVCTISALIFNREHLYRKHRLPKYPCLRCGTAFNELEPYKEHVRTAVPCELKPETVSEGLDKALEERLKSRKRIASNQSEEKKWKDMYAILFPGEPCASPCRFLIWQMHRKN